MILAVVQHASVLVNLILFKFYMWKFPLINFRKSGGTELFVLQSLWLRTPERSDEDRC